MKTTMTFFLILLTMLSCNEDPFLPLTPELVSSVKAYDLDNNGNSSDIRVDFKVIDNTNVFEYRVIIIPLSSSSSFTENEAATLPESNYFEVNPESFTLDYSISRLPSNMIDVNDNPIITGLEYVIAIFVFATGNHQLSEFSLPFTLEDRDPFTGIYVGSRYVDLTLCCASVNTCNPSNPDFGSATLIMATIRLSAGIYQGTLICEVCTVLNNEELTFSIADNNLSNVQVEHVGLCWGAQNCVGCEPGVDPCNYIFAAQGSLIGELGIEISYSGDDCEIALHEGTITLIRQ